MKHTGRDNPRTIQRAFPWKTFNWGLICLVAIILGILLLLPNRLIRRSLHTWNVYHYVIGTKYFEELGYFDIYRATLLASSEGEPIFPGVSRTRDLRTYQKKTVTAVVAEAKEDRLRERFTAERWREFKKDLGIIRSQRPDPKYWRGPLRDRGFNPTPLWLLVHGPLLNAFDLQQEQILFFLCYAQHLLFFVAFLCVYWAFGRGVIFVFIAFFCLYFHSCDTNLFYKRQPTPNIAFRPQSKSFNEH